MTSLTVPCNGGNDTNRDFMTEMTTIILSVIMIITAVAWWYRELKKQSQSLNYIIIIIRIKREKEKKLTVLPSNPIGP